MSSTAEAAAAARAPSVDAAHNATALFDTHMKVLSDSYLAFFQERYASSSLCLLLQALTTRAERGLRRTSEYSCIEHGGGTVNRTQYSVASLLKLHRKSKSIDSYMDDRMELSTSRVAWNEITDNVERGAYPFHPPRGLQFTGRDESRGGYPYSFPGKPGHPRYRPALQLQGAWCTFDLRATFKTTACRRSKTGSANAFGTM